MKRHSAVMVAVLIICAAIAGCGSKAAVNGDETRYALISTESDIYTTSAKETHRHTEAVTKTEKTTEETDGTDEPNGTDKPDGADKPNGTDEPDGQGEPNGIEITEAQSTEAPTAAPTEAPTETPVQPVTQEMIAEGTMLYERNRAEIQKVLAETNKIRKEAGFSPLVLDEQLCIEACVRAAELAHNNYFDHTRPAGRECFTLLDEMGISYCCAGENIAAGYVTAANVVEGWKNSTGHYANMVDPDFKKLGVGVIWLDSYQYDGKQLRVAWVQTFTD